MLTRKKKRQKKVKNGALRTYWRTAIKYISRNPEPSNGLHGLSGFIHTYLQVDYSDHDLHLKRMNDEPAYCPLEDEGREPQSKKEKPDFSI